MKLTKLYLVLLSCCLARAFTGAWAGPDISSTAAAKGNTTSLTQAAADAAATRAAVTAPPTATQSVNIDQAGTSETAPDQVQAIADTVPAHANNSKAAQDGTAGSADDDTAQYAPAVGCAPPTTPEPEPQGVTIQQLPPDQKPNFIIILTDDQGWDDIGLHHPHKPGSKPQFVNTPHIDKFLLNSKKFDNFYVAPMCSHTRAALLTGRDYPLTGTMLVNGGYDYINRGERTSADIMAAGGYKTAHFGKWHNGRTLGYEPWFMGFQESWFPDLYINLDNLMRHNGHYVQTYGLMEQDLMDKMLGYLDQQAANNSQPFYLYYAPNAIHQGFLRPGQGPKWQRPAPEPYLAKYIHLLDKNISISTIEVWAMLEYMDDVLGRLFDYVDNSPLKNNTYIMILSDNGSELFMGEMPNRDVRMPSGMQGYKRAVEEGGIRNFLGVQGPGVQAGVIDSTLLDVTDVLPTMVELAGLDPPPSDDLGFTGISFKNLLLAGDEPPATARLAQSLAVPEQKGRFLFALSPICWDPDSVPDLDKNREVIKPQTLLDYDAGGYNNALYSYFYNDTANSTQLGFERCIGVRYQDYKWVGRTNKVYRLTNNSHIELPCNQVTGPEGEAVAALMSGAARQWWKSLVASPHTFRKPTFYLGFEGWNVTNLLPDGAHDRTMGNVKLLPNGASGFKEPGDKLCFAVEVVTGGRYEVVLFHTSEAQATFSLSVGKFTDIQAGAAPSVTRQLPAAATMAGHEMGHLYLQPTYGQKIDACLVLEENSRPGQPVFTNLGNIRFTLESVATTSNDTAAELVYDSRNSSDALAAVHIADDGPLQNQQHTGQHNNHAPSRRNRRQHTRRHRDADTFAAAARSADAISRDIHDEHKAPGGFSTYHPPRTSNSIWVTKAARHNFAELIPHSGRSDNSAQKQMNTGHTSMLTEPGIALAAVKPLHGGRKAGPIHHQSDAKNPKTRRDTTPYRGHNTDNPADSEAASVVVHYTELPGVEAVHVGGKRGVSRQRLYKKHPAPLAAPAGGLNTACEYRQLLSNNYSRMRLGVTTAAQPEEVIGAMPDQPSGKKKTGSNADTMVSESSFEPQEHTKVTGVRRTQRSKTKQGQQDGSRGTSSTGEIWRRYLKATAAMRATEREAVREAARVHTRQQQQGDGSPDVDAAWRMLRLRNNWPDGQTRLESMFSPYHVEMIDDCRECQPEL